MLRACHLQRLVLQTARLSPSPAFPLSVCRGCLKRQFSQRAFRQLSVSSGIYRGPVTPSHGFKRLLATTGDTDQEKSPPSALPTKEGVSTPTAEGGQSSPSETVVKVQPTATRKKIDFTKEYPDNIYVESDRAKYEYLLTDKQLGELPVIQRRSPYPGSDNIKVYHRKHIMNKVNEVWGSLENLNKEKKSRKKWENIDSYLFGLRMAQQSYQIQHAKGEEEKPFLFKPFEKPEPKVIVIPFIFAFPVPVIFLKRDLGMRGSQPKKMSKNFDIEDTIVKRDTIFKTGSGKVVMLAIAVNGVNALLKFAAWLYTGSHSMFSECIHSIADTVNQIILALGINQSLKQADLEHPYGWSNFRNVASLISGVGIFCLGAGLSVYHGVMGLIHPHTMDTLFWGISILAGSFVSEGATLVVAINEVRRSAAKGNMSFMSYVWQGRDPSTNVVLLEDAAAVLGVAIAACCMGVTYYTGNPVADAVGSIFIGSLLGGVASFIIYTNTIALVGRSIPIDQKAKLMAELENDRMIRALHDVKATDMGASNVRFKAEVDFDGKEITRLYLEKNDLDLLMAEVKKMTTSEELETFMLKHGENIVDTLGGEVDRIEKNLKKRHPEVRHVDLEQL